MEFVLLVLGVALPLRTCLFSSWLLTDIIESAVSGRAMPLAIFHTPGPCHKVRPRRGPPWQQAKRILPQSAKAVGSGRWRQPLPPSLPLPPPSPNPLLLGTADVLTLHIALLLLSCQKHVRSPLAAAACAPAAGNGLQQHLDGRAGRALRLVEALQPSAAGK